MERSGEGLRGVKRGEEGLRGVEVGWRVREKSGCGKRDSSPSAHILLLQDIDTQTGLNWTPRSCYTSSPLPSPGPGHFHGCSEREWPPGYCSLLKGGPDRLKIQAECKILPGKKHSRVCDSVCVWSGLQVRNAGPGGCERVKEQGVFLEELHLWL